MRREIFHTAPFEPLVLEDDSSSSSSSGPSRTSSSIPPSSSSTPPSSSSISLSEPYRSVSYTSISTNILRPFPPNLKLWKVRWNFLNNNLSTTSDNGSAWGQATDGSLWKLWWCIDQFYKITGSDIIFDWGCGLGKMLFSAFFLCRVKCVYVGVEKENGLYGVCKRISRVMKFVEGCYCYVAHADSSLLEDFCPATVVVQYDGPNRSPASQTHKHIMQLAFTSCTVRVLFSTKLSPQLYREYFEGTSFEPLWRCVGIDGLMFGTSPTKGYLWVKRSRGRDENREDGMGGLQHLVNQARSRDLT